MSDDDDHRGTGSRRSGRGRPPSRPRGHNRAPYRQSRGAGREGSEDGKVWLFGIHAVRDALANPNRKLHRLILTQNALNRLSDTLAARAAEGRAIEPELADPRRFSAPLDPGSVHQGAALAAEPLDWGTLDARAAPGQASPTPVVLALDRVTDPHNVGAILRSAEVFGARAVIAPRRHAAPETGALAKAASGALERQPYVRVANLGNALETLKELGYRVLGLDGEGEVSVASAVGEARDQPLALVLGAEGPGLRARTREICDQLVRIESSSDFGSLNVSNAAAVALFAAAQRNS
ncbi:MAG: 23S rRNA (guanosine(2251)-2'-O)-methyltransferase RlmB [Pseudomonadota bacterium]